VSHVVLLLLLLLMLLLLLTAGDAPCGSKYGYFILFWPVRPEARTAQKKKHPAPLEGRGWRFFGERFVLRER
jgi:hypothetical protein